MPTLFEFLTEQERKQVKKKAMPSFIHPMLAQLTTDYFSDPDWIFEPKLDGERCLAFVKNGKVTLKSRNNRISNTSYPEIVEALENIAMPNCILDGEVVAFVKKITNFSKLQTRFGITSSDKARATKIKVFYYAFDIMYYDGYDLTHVPLLTRKHILKNCIPFQGVFRYLPHKTTKGLLYHEQACKKGWEGVMAKHKYSTYITKRSSLWLKFKCSNEQEFVIGGYTEPGGARSYFGALLLGYYEKDVLMYAGKVGTGFNEELLTSLGAVLHSLETSKNPFANYDDSFKDVHWVKPKLVCQIQFTEWTSTNKLRHPSFLGLRRDKKAKEVVKES